MRPILKQHGDLRAEDFRVHKVWISVHEADEAEAWYEECDEETFRPWIHSGAARGAGELVVALANLTLNSGSRYLGTVFARAARDGLRCSTDMGDLQPRIFVGNEAISFWGGLPGVPSADRKLLFGALELDGREIFPIRFEAVPGVPCRARHGVIEGFYQSAPRGGRVQIERSAESGIQDEPFAALPVGRDLQGVVRLASRGEWEASLKLATELIEEKPDDPERWARRSSVYWFRNDPGAAIPDAAKVVELEPSNAIRLRWLCFMQAKAGAFEDCLQNCRIGLATEYNSPRTEHLNKVEFQFLGARSLLGIGKAAEALAWLENIPKGYAIGKKGDVLMTKAGLLRACKMQVAEAKKLKRGG